MEQSAAEQVAALTAQVTALQQERDEVSASSSDAIARLSSYVSALEREKYELLDSKAVEDAEKTGQIATLRRQVRGREQFVWFSRGHDEVQRHVEKVQCCLVGRP